MSIICNLGPDLLLTRTVWGGHVVVPSYNVDVSIGIARDSIHEAWTTRLVQELLKPGQTYVNVGANFGYYTCLGALRVGSAGKVIAIEANPTVFSILMKTMLWAGITDRVDAYNRAAFDETGRQLDFDFDYQFIGGGHLRQMSQTRGMVEDVQHKVLDSPFWTPENVPNMLDANGKWIYGIGLPVSFKAVTMRLDDLPDGLSVDLLHCDVEGAEPFVLTGARRILDRSPQCKIIFEWAGWGYQVRGDDYRKKCEDMWNMLAHRGYYIRHLKPFTRENGAIELSHRLNFEEFIQGAHGDYLAVKNEQDAWK